MLLYLVCDQDCISRADAEEKTSKRKIKKKNQKKESEERKREGVIDVTFKR
jgi:hypothetical protein